MPEILPYKLLSFSSEDELYPAKNLLKGSSSYQWKCKNSSEQEASIEFEFDVPTKFTRIELGNNSTAFIEIQVSRFPENKDYQVLLGSTSLMTPIEAVKCEGLGRVRCFKEMNFSKSVSRERWDILKVICTQPFNKTLQYGLSFIKFYCDINCVINANDDIVIGDESRIDVNKLISVETAETKAWRPGFLFTNKIKTDSTTKKEITILKSSPVHQHEKCASQPQITTYSLSIPNDSSEKEIINSNPLSSSENNLKRKHIDNINDNSLNKKKDVGIKNSQINSDQSSNIKIIKIDSSQTTNTLPKNLKSIEQPKLSSNSKPDETVIKKISKPSCNTQINSSDIAMNSENRHDLPTSSSSCSNDNQQNQSSNILANVVFVLSGYQNPLRNTLRDKAIALGAKYRSSWTNDSTHLICAFHNTPKFKEVSGKGIIVKENWILDCYSRKKHLPWRDYRVKGAPSPDKLSHKDLTKVPHNSVGTTNPVSVNRSSSSSGSPSISTEVQSNDGDDPNTNQFQRIAIDSLPVLPAIFNDLHFFFYGICDSEEFRFLKRLIFSFGGILHEYMDPSVSIVVTDCSWDSSFDQALDCNPRLTFVKSSWLRRCDEKGCLVSFDEFEISKLSL